VLRRTLLRSPVKGLVKNIRVNTLGGVVAAGAPVMEIVPLGPRVLVEARVRPADIGFVRVGQEVQVKLSAYDYTTYGGLHGTIEHISPDALGDTDAPARPTPPTTAR
jgi:membrane fusion protein, adhesin transport system